jgi:hypothetical protein
MKRGSGITAIIAVCLMTGCTTTPVAFPAVGPNPYAKSDGAENGRLEVFSSMETQVEGDNPIWFQHTDYDVLTAEHKPLKRVWNKVAHYAEEPRVVSLPAGNYFVVARSIDSFSVEVPVVIQPGKLTTVHLDGKWSPPLGTTQSEITYSPGDYAVGWRSALINR